MEVILLERVEKLGQMGDVVRVKDGYARNYLLPQQKALRATDENRAGFEVQKVQLETVSLERRTEAEQVAAKMADLSCVLLRQASESGQLYGSANARDVSAAVTEAGFTVERKQVQLNHAIKTLGLQTVGIRLHPEVLVSVTLNVARTPAEAAAQAAGESAAAAEGAETEAAQAVEVAEEFFETAELAAQAQAETEAGAEEEAAEKESAVPEDSSESPAAEIPASEDPATS